jgi:hypothetical protein
MSAFEEFAIEIREFYDLDTVYPYRVGQAYAKAAAELERLQAIEAAAQKFLDATADVDLRWSVRAARNHLARALSPQPGVIGDEKG